MENQKGELQIQTLQKHGEKILKRTLQELSDKDEPIFISNEITSLTIELASNSKQISLLKKENGEQYLQIAISKIIKEAIKFLPSKMPAEDIIYFAKFFSKEYWYWKYDDLILCFKKGIAKEYGEIFGEFNISVFQSWALKYEKEKEDFVAKLAYGFDQLYKNREDVIIVDGNQTQEQVLQETLAKLVPWIPSSLKATPDKQVK